MRANMYVAMQRDAKSKSRNLIGLRENRTAELAQPRKRSNITRPFSLREGGVCMGTRLYRLKVGKTDRSRRTYCPLLVVSLASKGRIDLWYSYSESLWRKTKLQLSIHSAPRANGFIDDPKSELSCSLTPLGCFSTIP